MQRMLIVTAVATAIAAGPLFSAPQGQDQKNNKRVKPALTGNHVHGYDSVSVFVRYSPNTSDSQKAQARKQVRGTSSRSSGLVSGLEHMALAPGMTVERAVHVLNKLPFVEYAHPNYRLHLDQVPPDDEYFLEQWGLNNTGQASLYGAFLPGTPDADTDWLEASPLATGEGVVVAVLDTGIDYRHSDISPNLWINEAEMNGVSGVDDDGNGYVDDVRGWDFVNEDPYPLDGHGHGTMVAGIIAAATGNTKGVAGVMPNGRVMALKVIGDGGEGTLADAIEAIEYAVDKGVRISNSSWGYSVILPEESADHNALFDAMQAAQANEHLFVTAAGNDGIDTDGAPHYPSSFELDNIIAVNATDNTDTLAWFSSYGASSVDIAAPGDGVISVTKLFAGFLEDYAWESGTSLAAPHVAGVAGLILELQPGFGYQQIKDRILSTARVVPGLAGKSVTGGILNAYDAMNGLSIQVVGIDVLPGDTANAVYPNQSGKLPVAVLGSAEFDATQVNPASLKFGVGQAAPVSAPVIANVDGQFGPDTTVKFAVEDSGIACDDTEVSLSGETYSGDAFIGQDAIDASACETGGCHAY